MAYAPATASPMVSLYDDSNAGPNTMIRSVVPVFDLVSAKELPFLKFISGGDDNSPGLNSLSEPCVSTKFEWMEEQDAPLVSSVGASTVGSTNTTTFAVTSTTQARYFRVGDVIQVESEHMWVSAIDTSTAVLTVTRAWGGTTGATHAAAVPVTIIGRAHPEGSVAPDDLTQLGTMPYNYVQEFAASFKLSDIEQSVRRYGRASAIELETDRKTRELLRRMERQALFGLRVQGVAATPTPAAFGGLPQYVPTANKYTPAGGNLTKALLNTYLGSVFADVGMAGMPDTLLVSGFGAGIISQLYTGTSGTYQTFRDQADPIGGTVIERVRTDLAELQVVRINDLPTGTMFAVKKDRLGIGPLKGEELRRVLLAKTGTSDQYMIYGSYTMQVRNSLSHFMMSGITGIA